MEYLFEVSWDVCNRTGGLHTVLKSKISHVIQRFGDGYFLFGPYLDDNSGFKEASDPSFEIIRPALEAQGLRARLGRWDVSGSPKVILVDFRDRYDVNKLLYSYWKDFGLDSYAGRWDYIEPVLFSTACGEAIAAISQALSKEDDSAVAHFHGWQMGGGLLHLKKHMPEVGTVFTIHETVLGRCMSGLGRDIHAELEGLNSYEEAKTYGVPAKHSMEMVAAREADCFTTVSDILAAEAQHMLGKRPDLVIPNGLNVQEVPDFSSDRSAVLDGRSHLLEVAANFLQKDISDDTRLWVTSGRYEFQNKGYDLLLEAYRQLGERLQDDESAKPVVLLVLVPASERGVHEAVRRRITGGKDAWLANAEIGLTTHRLQDEHNDPIVKACNRLNLRNSKESKFHVIYSPAYLDGADGIFNVPYEQILAACDLGVFPSLYEPWGYTPHEAVLHAVPAITSDLAGFGDWAEGKLAETGPAVTILHRKGIARQMVVEDLVQELQRYASISNEDVSIARKSARSLAEHADWQCFFDQYLQAYDRAIEHSSGRFNILESGTLTEATVSTFKGPQHSATPHYRSFTVVSSKPEELEGLYEIAQNLWWSWSTDARELFMQIDQKRWVATDCNPVKLLHQVPSEQLQKKTQDKAFMKLYRKVWNDFRQYMDDTSFELEEHPSFSQKAGIAYFSMEFGLHECLPIYSGGLGVLAGDHLKAASDLNLPLFGVGLFYRQGYFTQTIDQNGWQQEQFPLLDGSMLPIQSVTDKDGNEARVWVDLPGRRLFARVWEVKVGRIKLYLLDSDVEQNEPDDRWLTSQLYGGDRRTRIKQEILVGIGGVRLIEDVLQLSPRVYHMNEGHCAFLSLERMKRFIEEGLSPLEAREAVKSSTVFTTHTPVPAGNEAFDPDLMGHYLYDYVQQIGIDWKQFLELGFQASGHEQEAFSMTVFALKLCNRANGVAKLHGRVSRDMWKTVWRGVEAQDVPIFSITNGVHMQTWVSGQMRKLISDKLPIRWGRNEDDASVWEKVDSIADDELWSVHQRQKEAFIERLKSKIEEDYTRRGENPRLIRETVDGLRPDTLTIGFARRFATYKRAALFLLDSERLKRILTNHERPVQIIFAGKAHPADVEGKKLIQAIVNASRWGEFKGKIVFLENYNMGIGRLLTRGVDVWLNNPLRPHEASGTSGMKLGPNGGLNFSILDGWWDEAYNPGIGWEINAGQEFRNADHQNEQDNRAMLDVLEDQIVSLYYQRNERGYSPGWVAMMKNSLREVSSYFNTNRMVREYYELSYLPTAKRDYALIGEDYKGMRELTNWKRSITSRFRSLEIVRVDTKGITGDVMRAGDALKVTMHVRRGKLSADEIMAELVLMQRNNENATEKAESIALELVGDSEADELCFRCEKEFELGGNYVYAVRVMPVHPLLSSPLETGLMCWGS